MAKNKKTKRSFRQFMRRLSRKHRLSLRNEHTDSEEWYMHISPLELIGSVVAVLLILFIIVLSTVAYTPILNLLPGYPGSKAREQIIQSIMKVDSLSRRLDEIQAYTSDISLILDGKTPITRNVEQIGDSIKGAVPEIVPPTVMDSMLRRQLEGTGVYGLGSPADRRQTGLDLMTPVRGVVAAGFNPSEGHYGIGIATATNEQVLAVDDGTIVLSTWTPTDGYIIQIQHGNNLLSIYKRSTMSIKSPGARVKGGEVIGYTGEGISGEEGKGLFEFELWYNGAPVDPESYIVF